MNSNWELESIVPGFGEIYVSRYKDFKIIRIECRYICDSKQNASFLMKHCTSNIGFKVSSMETAFKEFKEQIEQYIDLFKEVKQAIEDTQKEEQNEDDKCSF